jgi:prepilin-type N-terminal cleavage/methylation domain-containing protein
MGGKTLIGPCRLGDDEAGFTLIEVLVTLVVLAVLLAVAIPAYLGFDDRASRSTAQANLRTALPALATYYSDNDSYVGLTLAALRSYDQSIADGITVVSSAAATYCVRSMHRGEAYYKNGPAGSITTTVCS